MRTVMRAALGVAVGLATAGLAAGCGKAGSSGTQAAKDVQGAGCAPVAGQQLVMLTDDKKWQVADNIIPAVNAKAADPTLVAALDKVSAALGAKELASLNKATDIDRKTSKVAAEEFAASVKLTDGIAKGAGGKITVGAANFSENETLGELYRVALEAAGYQATVQKIGNRELYEPALEKGEIQVVPEYIGTLTEFLNKKANSSAAQQASGDVDKTVAALTDLGSKAGLKFGKPAQAADQNAFAVTKEFASKYKVSTLSDFADKCSGKATILGGPAECPQRPLCKVGLEQTYKIQFGQFASLDAGGPQTKNALRTGTASIGLVLSSDAAFATN